MDAGPIKVERLGRITRITMDRQARRNALDRAAQSALSDALDVFAADGEQWVAILTGAGVTMNTNGFAVSGGGGGSAGGAGAGAGGGGAGLVLEIVIKNRPVQNLHRQ